MYKFSLFYGWCWTPYRLAEKISPRSSYESCIVYTDIRCKVMTMKVKFTYHQITFKYFEIRKIYNPEFCLFCVNSTLGDLHYAGIFHLKIFFSLNFLLLKLTVLLMIVKILEYISRFIFKKWAIILLLKYLVLYGMSNIIVVKMLT